jgi:hypothetical protein
LAPMIPMTTNETPILPVPHSPHSGPEGQRYRAVTDRGCQRLCVGSKEDRLSALYSLVIICMRAIPCSHRTLRTSRMQTETLENFDDCKSTVGKTSQLDDFLSTTIQIARTFFYSEY